MSTPFAITAASNSLFLDADRTGEVTFTVSNQSGRAIEGRARLVVEAPEAEAWVTLRGAAQRSFAIAGTEQYTAAIEVPKEARGGSYTLRLDMVGEERPDEQYVEGPQVTFEVAEAEAEERSFPWKWVAAVAAVLVIGGGVLAYSLLSGGDDPEGPGTVPAVAGLTIAQATDSLEAAGFDRLDPQDEHNDSVGVGRVIGTIPGARAKVPVDSSIVVLVSQGPSTVTVPEVEGVALRDAIGQLTERNLTPTGLNVQNHSTIPAKQAIRTDPPAGSEVAEGSDLTLFVSIGASSGGGGGPKPGDLGIDLEEWGPVFEKKFVQPGQTVELNPKVLEEMMKAQANQ